MHLHFFCMNKPCKGLYFFLLLNGFGYIILRLWICKKNWLSVSFLNEFNISDCYFLKSFIQNDFIIPQFLIFILSLRHYLRFILVYHFLDVIIIQEESACVSFLLIMSITVDTELSFGTGRRRRRT